MFIIEGWDGAHCVAFFILPQIMVRHFEIGPAVPKLGVIEVFRSGYVSNVFWP